MKKTIQLTENELKRMVMESVKIIINENEEPLTWVYMRNTLNLMLKALENKDVEQLTARNANLQRLITKIGSQQQPMQQQSQVQQQPMQKQPQVMPRQQQQPTNINNDTMVDNQVQQQMQRNLALQQQMADRIRQGVANKNK